MKTLLYRCTLVAPGFIIICTKRECWNYRWTRWENCLPLSKLAFSAGRTGLGQDEMKARDGLKAGTKITIREVRRRKMQFLNCLARVPAGSSPPHCRSVGAQEDLMLPRGLGDVGKGASATAFWERCLGPGFDLDFRRDQSLSQRGR